MVAQKDIVSRFDPLVEWLAEKLTDNHAKLMCISKMQEAVWWCMKSISEDELNKKKEQEVKQ